MIYIDILLTYRPIYLVIIKPIPQRQNAFANGRITSHPRSHYTISVVEFKVAVRRRIGKFPRYCVHADEGTG